MEAPRHWTARACRDPPALRGFALGNPARARARLRRPEPAMLLMGYAATCWASHFGPLGRADRQPMRRVQSLVRAQLGAARAAAGCSLQPHGGCGQ